MAVKRGRKKEIPEANLALLKAVKASVAIQSSTGTDRQTHCRIFNGFVIATNDVQIVGVPIVGLSLDCCPHSKTFVAALERCEGDITFTLEGHTLTVKSGRVRVPVPCIADNALLDLFPDASQGSASPALAEALGRISAVVDETDDRLFCRAVYMSADFAQGTHKGHVVMQAWHGVKPLPNLALPKESAHSIAKHPSKLVGLGLGTGTATFWYEDNSFIRTCLFDMAPPNFDGVLQQKIVKEPSPIDSELFGIVRGLLPFTKEALTSSKDANVVSFEDGKVWAGQSAQSNFASYDFPVSPITDFALNANYLLMFEGYVETIVVDNFENKLFLYGDSLRGVIAGFKDRR